MYEEYLKALLGPLGVYRLGRESLSGAELYALGAGLDAVAARLDGKAGCLRQKYLSEETLSIIGCMDVMVGVRLHSLIYAAVMGVPMIGVSYDPKVDSFLSSIQRPTHFTVEDFTLEGFQAAFRETMENREAICETTARRLEELISKLDQNEDLIRGIMEQAK